MAKDQKHIIVSGYTYGLLQQAVDKGNASDIAEAVAKSVSLYLGIRYKPKKELKMEQDLARIQELGKMVKKEE
jgi:hypothetical protein